MNKGAEDRIDFIFDYMPPARGRAASRSERVGRLVAPVAIADRRDHVDQLSELALVVPVVPDRAVVDRLAHLLG